MIEISFSYQALVQNSNNFYQYKTRQYIHSFSGSIDILLFQIWIYILIHLH